jgi:hypothetical protein
MLLHQLAISLDRHLFNLGHGFSQCTPPANVAVLVEAEKKLKKIMSRHYINYVSAFILDRLKK